MQMVIVYALARHVYQNNVLQGLRQQMLDVCAQMAKYGLLQVDVPQNVQKDKY